MTSSQALATGILIEEIYDLETESYQANYQFENQSERQLDLNPEQNIEQLSTDNNTQLNQDYFEAGSELASSSTAFPSKSLSSKPTRNIRNLLIPKYCYDTCSNCKVKQFKFNSLNSLELATSQELNAELSRHGHPSSMKMRRHKSRSKKQASAQLKDHLVFVHKLDLR
jgi:hypothetical protein